MSALETLRAALPNCHVCDGTGRVLSLKSWSASDGFTASRCGICSGTGRSKFKAPDYAKEQRYLRKLAAADRATNQENN